LSYSDVQTAPNPLPVELHHAVLACRHKREVDRLGSVVAAPARQQNTTGHTDTIPVMKSHCTPIQLQVIEVPLNSLAHKVLILELVTRQ
jgi:hypothetical protein